jgi:uncharacterized membrane protein YcaP (DUF421 family)
MLNFSETLLEIVIRTAIVYLVILIGIRLAGKREVGQMTPFDLVLLLLISNAVQNAMTGPDTSVTGGIVAASTLLLLNAGAMQLVWRNRKARKIIEGTPTLLIRHGKIIEQHLAKEKVTVESLTQALREHGIATISDVSIAVLEIDGSISVLKNDEVPPADRPHRHIRFISRKNT